MIEKAQDLDVIMLQAQLTANKEAGKALASILASKLLATKADKAA